MDRGAVCQGRPIEVFFADSFQHREVRLGWSVTMRGPAGCDRRALGASDGSGANSGERE
jgi:hypothetical protein